MATDEERRIIAERLRMADDRDAAGFDCLLANVVRGCYFCKTSCESCHRRLLGELVDLIEPSDHIGDSDKMVDREALLRLADEIDREADWRAEKYGKYHGSGQLWSYARRIRKACGVVA